MFNFIATLINFVVTKMLKSNARIEKDNVQNLCFFRSANISAQINKFIFFYFENIVTLS